MIRRKAQQIQSRGVRAPHTIRKQQHIRIAVAQEPKTQTTKPQTAPLQNNTTSECETGNAPKKPIKRNIVKPLKPKKTAISFPAIDPTHFSGVPLESLAHGNQVALLSMQLFSGLKALHQLQDSWGTILYYAACLHDIGWIKGQRKHHKRSAKMIRASEALVLDEATRGLVALVARYHRRAEPSRHHKRFGRLSPKQQHGVRCLAALLRLADALDFSHAKRVSQVWVADLDKKRVLLELCCPDTDMTECRAEILRVARNKMLFKKVFQKDIRCQCKEQKKS